MSDPKNAGSSAKDAKPTIEDFIGLLSHFDPLGQGTVAQFELRQFLAHGDEGLTEKEIHNLLHYANALGDETNINDFVHTIMEDS